MSETSGIAWRKLSSRAKEAAWIVGMAGRAWREDGKKMLDGVLNTGCFIQINRLPDFTMSGSIRISGFLAIAVVIGIVTACKVPDRGQAVDRKPNILFVIADDQSYPHASAYGMKAFKTPAFDRIARRGVLFSNAFVAAPQCSPSRAAILTGRNIWQLEEAGTHSSYFPKKFPVFTDVLKASGYAVAYTGKAWGPGNWKDTGWPRNPVGKEYNDHRFKTVPFSGISKVDYAANFKTFLDERPKDQPFFFWFGAYEPHRVYAYGSGKSAGLKQDDLKLPGFLPENDSVVTDLLDYALEISWFDQQLGKMLVLLEESGALENTIIVVTADNGMPFPHAKANLQEYGIHVPLAICGPSVKGNRTVDDLVSLIDLAPTFLEASGAGEMDGITGKSLLPILQSRRSGTVDPMRNYILAGRERHTHARPDNTGYPARAIRTEQFLYIRNFRPERWPVGDPPPDDPVADASDPDLKDIVLGYEDIDHSPTKEVMLRRKKEWPNLFHAAFEKRAEEQLFDVRTDPSCLNDLSGDKRYESVLNDLRQQLTAHLLKEGDPRITGAGDVFDSYPRFAPMRRFDGFRRRGEYNKAFEKN